MTLWEIVLIWAGIVWVAYRSGRARFALLGLCLGLWPLIW